jgi:hypothetical protein
VYPNSPGNFEMYDLVYGGFGDHRYILYIINFITLYNNIIAYYPKSKPPSENKPPPLFDPQVLAQVFLSRSFISSRP